MSVGRVVVIALGAICLVLAAVYLISPETIGGAPTQGELMPQAGMPGGSVSYTFTKIPLGVGELVVPVFSAVVIFGLLGIALLVAGLTARSKGAS